MRWASNSSSIEQSDPRIPLKKSTFSTGCADRIARPKKMGSKRHFFDCVRMPDLVSDRKSPFSIHRSDCRRIGLRMQKSKKWSLPGLAFGSWASGYAWAEAACGIAPIGGRAKEESGRDEPRIYGCTGSRYVLVDYSVGLREYLVQLDQLVAFQERGNADPVNIQHSC